MAVCGERFLSSPVHLQLKVEALDEEQPDATGPVDGLLRGRKRKTGFGFGQFGLSSESERRRKVTTKTLLHFQGFQSSM